MDRYGQVTTNYGEVNTNYREVNAYYGDATKNYGEVTINYGATNCAIFPSLLLVNADILLLITRMIQQ